MLNSDLTNVKLDDVKETLLISSRETTRARARLMKYYIKLDHK